MSHLYRASDLPADHREQRPCAHCGLPAANRTHDTSQIDAAQAEAKRRIGDQDADENS